MAFFLPSTVTQNTPRIVKRNLCIFSLLLSVVSAAPGVFVFFFPVSSGVSGCLKSKEGGRFSVRRISPKNNELSLRGAAVWKTEH